MTPRILICEDENLLAKGLSRSLSRLGYEVVGTTPTGEEAIEMAERLKPDLILMDINLEGDMDGIEAAALAHSRFDIPFVYLTAHADAEILERAKPTAPYGYLIKPTIPSELKSSIEIALYKHKKDKELRDSEELHRIVLSNTTDAVFLTDSEGRFTYISPNAHITLGYSRKEIEELGTAEALLGKGLFDPEALEEKGEIRNIARTVQRKDHGEVALLIDVKRVSFKWGAVVYACRDVTELKRAEDALKKHLDELELRVRERTEELRQSNRELRESKLELEALFNACDQSVLLIDEHCRILALNETTARRLGATSDQMLGKDIFDFLPPEVVERRRPVYEEVIRTGEIRRREDERLGRIIHSTLFPIMGPDNTVSKVAIFAIDLTEFRQAEKSLRRAHMELRTAHDALKQEILERERAQGELSVSEQRHRLVCESAPVGLAILRADETFEYVNPRFSEIFGYRVEDLPGLEAWSLATYPDENYRRQLIDASRKAEEARRSSAEARSLRSAVRRSDGEEKIVASTTVPMEDGKRLISFADVTEETRLQERIGQAKDEWERTFDAVSELIVIMDREGSVRRVNQAAADFFELGFKELIGKKCHQLFHDSEEAPDFCPFAQGGVESDEPWFRVFDTRDSKTIEASCYPVQGRDNKVAYSVMVCRDVTERNAKEERLRMSEQLFRAIFESARDIMYLKNSSKRYSLVNPAMANMLGMDVADIIGRTDESLFGKDVATLLQDADDRVLAGSAVEQETTRSIHGDQVTLLEMKIPLQDAAGRVTRICGIAHDITGRRPVSAVRTVESLPAKSSAMRSVLELAARVARFDTTILVTGETGVGKDYLAKHIHDSSLRAGGPYFSINCASLPSELAESELFGHEGGAFTSAKSRKRGMLELAEGGTLLLNEIGDLSLGLQAKLLTFLDSRQFLRVGGEQPVSVNARLIAATNRDLEKEAASGRFRSDLFFRLNVYRIAIPPLRERTEDLPIIARSVLKRLAGEFQLPLVPGLSADIIDKLSRYYWPGNVRELRNVLERSLILSGGGPLTSRSLILPEREGEETGRTLTIEEDRTLNDAVAELKRKLVASAIERCRGNKSQAAQLLGIPRSSLSNYLKM